jgi:hypothetical protein
MAYLIKYGPLSKDEENAILEALIDDENTLGAS